MVWGEQPVSARRLCALVRGLPRDSAYVRRLIGDHADYSYQDARLADLVDLTAAVQWLLVEVHRDPQSSQPAPAPDPVPRPWSTTPAAAAAELPPWAAPSSREEIRAFFARSPARR